MLQNDLEYYMRHGYARKLTVGDKYGHDYYANVHDYEVGDVNHDQIVDIEDVTALIAYILGNADGICTDCANVNGIGAIDIEDVTALISKVLGN